MKRERERERERERGELTGWSSPKRRRWERPESLACLRSVLVSGRLRSMLSIQSCRDDQVVDVVDVPAPLQPDGGGGGHRTGASLASLGGFQVGEAGGVGEPGETVIGLGVDGSEEAVSATEALAMLETLATLATLLPRR